MTRDKVDSILDLVGGTPLVRINRMAEAGPVKVYAKLEFMNPGGSVKDRPALKMIEEAERRGDLTPAKIVLEATSGNTGIGLAMVCAVRGYRMLFTMSESASAERRKILRAYGAQILLTPAHLSTDGAIEEAYRLAREHPQRYFLVDQFNNDDNWRAHYEAGTADEIYRATDGRVRVVVATLGTSGTAMGLARRLHELDPAIRLVAVEPYQGHKIQGLKNMVESYAPGIYDPTEPDAIVHVDDDSAYETARRLAREEGIFVGMSAGAAMKVALDQARELDDGEVVALLADGGERYLSTPLFVSERTPVPLRFFNTLTRRLDDLAPVRPGHVGIYACGPSLDGPADLGLCRRMVFADLVRRYLKLRGFEVKLVVNISDMDDRTVGQCLAEGTEIGEFRARQEARFFGEMASLRVQRAHEHPRSSEYVPQMIEVTRQLLDRRFAYEKLRSVYFDPSRFGQYGALSRVDPGATRQGGHGGHETFEKANPRDFALFKRSSLAELKAGIYVKTPWGNARPGWHVECATMSVDLLGQPFDLHLASTDLVFPHGENEIAVAEAASGLPYARLWVHSEVVRAGGRKISRAAGNDLTLADLVAQGFEPRVVRLWLLAQHHRRALEYSEDQLALARRTLRRLDDFADRLRGAEPGDPAADVDALVNGARQLVRDALDRDLHVPRALARLFTLVKQINRRLDRGQLDRAQLDQVMEFLVEIDGVLGVLQLRPQDADAEIEALLQRRERARERGDYDGADRLRDQLSAAGIQVEDGPRGPRWRRS
jgi:cysteinyl-tRNA synthetase